MDGDESMKTQDKISHKNFLFHPGVFIFLALGIGFLIASIVFSMIVLPNVTLFSLQFFGLAVGMLLFVYASMICFIIARNNYQKLPKYYAYTMEKKENEDAHLFPLFLGIPCFFMSVLGILGYFVMKEIVFLFIGIMLFLGGIFLIWIFLKERGDKR